MVCLFSIYRYVSNVIKVDTKHYAKLNCQVYGYIRCNDTIFYATYVGMKIKFRERIKF